MKKIEKLKKLRNALLYYKASIEHDEQINNQFVHYEKSKEKVKILTLFK